MEWWRLLAHNHWVTIRIGNRESRLCARCSGTVLGYLSTLTFSEVVGLDVFHTLMFAYQFFLCCLFILPVALDWLTQTWRLRRSNNRLRVVTGFLEGVGVALFTYTSIPPLMKLSIVSGLGASIVIFGIAGKKVSDKFKFKKPGTIDVFF